MNRARGLSLIEVAVLMLFLSLALIPMVRAIGGSNMVIGTGGAQRSGSTTRLVGMKSKEVVFANAMMERALAGEFTIFNTTNQGTACTGGNLPAANSGATATFNCIDRSYSDPIYYQWIVRDRSNEFRVNQGQPVGTEAMGNRFFSATLNIYNNDSWSGNPIVTFPTGAVRNSFLDTPPNNTTGIVIVLDISGSMQSEDIRPVYRYSDGTYTPPAGIALANLFDNTTLDITASLTADDPNTPFDDRYPEPGVLGIPNPPGCPNALQTDPFVQNYGNSRTNWRRLCQKVPPGTYIENNLSRIEAARSSLLNFLVTIENDQTLRDNILLGFTTFEGSGGGNHVPRVPTTWNGVLEAPTGGQYVNMRRRLSWINRVGAGGPVAGRSIMPGGGTPTWNAVNSAAQLLYAQNNLGRRAIFLITDGEPTSGNCIVGSYPAIGNCFRTTLGTALGNGTYPGSNGNTVTVYGLGLLANATNMNNTINVGFVQPTNGTFAMANSIGEIDAVFEDIKYAILRDIIISKANRYGIQYN